MTAVGAPKWLTLICLVCLFITTGESAALTGTGDAPPFGLNTRWTSSVEDPADLPSNDRLTGCYPNPFNPLTSIQFELAEKSVVNLRIYDLQGRLVKSLVANETIPAGRHSAEWDGRDERGAQAAAGVYLYRLITEDFSGSRRMTLVK